MTDKNKTEQVAAPAVADIRCEVYVQGGWAGPRKCSRKRALGDTVCKQHRASAERTGYDAGRIVGGGHE